MLKDPAFCDSNRASVMARKLVSATEKKMAARAKSKFRVTVSSLISLVFFHKLKGFMLENTGWVFSQPLIWIYEF